MVGGLPAEMQNVCKLKRHRTISSESSIEQGQHLPNTARGPEAKTYYIMVASPTPA